MTDISNVNTFVVIGTGTMGREIAQVALMANFKAVVLNDIEQSALESATAFIENGLQKLEKKGLLAEGLTTESLMNRLVKEIDLKKAVAEADFIVEAIPEKMEMKKGLFQKLGTLTPSHAIFATNTSTMSITEIASESERPEKVVGMHFFTPIPILRVIEVIKGAKTSEEIMDITVAVGQKLPCVKGKRIIARIEKESPGFIVNRLTVASAAYIHWLLDYALENSIPFEEIDADVADLGMGPCAKMDYLGLDTQFNVFSYFAEALSPDFTPGKALTKLVKEGNLGKKTGKGFCIWSEEGKPIVDPNKRANLFNSELFMALQLNEGCRLLEEGIVSGYKTIDDTILGAMSMPGPFGPGKRNYKKWCKLLEEFVEKSGKEYFRPCELMRTGGFLKMR